MICTMAKWIIPIIQVIFIKECCSFYHELSMKSTDITMPDDSLFGYSVTYQPQIQSLVISAPTADKIGQVFIYDIKRSNSTKVEFDLKIEDKNYTGYWLGADVKAGSSFFTTCAPRYVAKEGTQNGTFGRCFVKSFEKPQSVQIMQAMSKSDRAVYGNKFENLMDSFGWSIDVTSQNNILIGGPAMSKGRVIQYRNISDYPLLIRPQNNTANKDFFNFGYSISSGNYFSSDQKNISYAISTTYGNKGIGQIHFYNESGIYLKSLIDSEPGLATLFGAALCTAKLGGEQASLLIGAPAYVPDDAHDVDLGAVYIYLPNNENLVLKRTIRGQEFGGRFGSAIVNIGDMDSDDKDDIAIAAPYESDGNGAVYIYTADNILSDKMMIKYAQKIQPKGYKGFGLSMTALKEYNGNGCNELAVGAPYSNAVFMLNCFSSINVKLFTVLPNLQNQMATDKEKFSIQTCLNVSFANRPKNIVANILVKVSTMHPSARLEESKNGIFSYIETLRRNKTIYCKDVVILSPLDKNIELYPIQITVNAQLEKDPRLLKEFNPERVILGDRSVLSVIEIIWVSGCSSTFCIPILHTRIMSSMTSPYVVGSSNAENVSVSITNLGETAYSACARIRVGKNTGSINLDTKSLTSRDGKITISVDTYNHCGNVTNGTPEERVVDLKTDIDGLSFMSEAIPGDVVNISYVNLNTDLSHLYTIINNGVTNWVGVRFLIALNNSFAEIRSPILILTDGEKRECYLNMQKGAVDKVVTCAISEIRKNQKIYIMVNLNIPPLSNDLLNEYKNVSVTSVLHSVEDYEIKTIGVNTTLVKVHSPYVPIWIYIGAGFVAVLVLLVIVIIFYECGFLQRKNKVLLKDLKRDVRRQSMRRTMILREQMRAERNQPSEDAKELIENREDGNEINCD
ncbi:unnamed protein product, partial [Iphiclides podalirius]